MGEDVTLEAFNRVQILCLAFYGNGIISLSEYAALELLLMICNICNLNSIAKVIRNYIDLTKVIYHGYSVCVGVGIFVAGVCVCVS